MKNGLLEKILICVLTVGFILSLQYIFFGNKEIDESNKEEMEAYTKVLHRVWIDNPTYVEDYLFETDEFINLANTSNFGDAFLFWSDKDSIEYYRNYERDEEMAAHYIKHKCQPCDSSKCVIADTIKNVPMIELKLG